MKVISVFFLMFFALTGSLLHAQDQSYVLTLDQAREYALQHNKTLLNARDNVTSSKQKYNEVRAQGLPQIDGGLDFMTYFNYELNFSFGSSGGGTLPDFTVPPYDAGDEQLFYAIMGMLGSSSEPIIMDNQLSGKVQVSQLIFSGQYWAGLQTAKIAKGLTEQNLVRSELDVVENITNSYYVTLVTEQNLRIIEDNIKNLSAILQHTENMYKTGIAEETDVDQLRITVNQLQNSQKALERMIQLNYNMLRFQLGVEPSAKITLTDNIDQIIGSIQPENAIVNNFDLSGNINYQMGESQVKMSEKQVGLQNWAYAPTIAGYYSYTKKILTTGFDMTPNHLAGVTMSVPIFSSGMRKAQVSQAKISRDIALRNQEMIKEQLETQERQLIFNYQSALENFNTQKENIEVANRVYTKIQNKFRQGMVSSLDLTQANSNLLSAESNYLSSVLTLLQAQTSLDKLYNKL